MESHAGESHVYLSRAPQERLTYHGSCEGRDLLTGENVLELLAEVSVALVGFTGVVAAFGMREDSLSEVDVLRFRAMLYASIAALLFSLLPLVLFHLNAPEEWVWAVSSFAMVLYVGALQFWTFRRLSNVALTADPSYNLWISRSISLLMTVVLVIEFLNAFGILIERSFAFYLLGLMALLVLCVVMFVRMLSFIGRSP